MRRRSSWKVCLVIGILGTAACGGSGLPVPAPVPERAGCYVVGPEAAAWPFLFPDTLELAADWFLPQDSTGGRLRVVRPRDAALRTYRTYGGRFWWGTVGDSIVVTRSDGVTGAVLAFPSAPPAFTGVIRTSGPGLGVMEYVTGRRVPCAEPPRRPTAQPPHTSENRP
jgi:hypothetical protein